MRLVVLMVISMMSGSSWTLTGDNICPEPERYLVNVTRTIAKTIQIRNYKWCVNFPPRCSYYTEEERLVPETVEEEEVRIVQKCCPGFDEDEQSATCISGCAKCQHGQCKFNRCICDSGFQGDDCDEVCPPSFWGSKCENSCTCQNGECDPKSGFCACYEGWTGENCNDHVTTTPPPSTKTVLVKTTTTFGQQDHLLLNTSRTKYPTTPQKYHTLFITTQNPQLANLPDTKKTIVRVSASSNGRLNGTPWLMAANVTNTSELEQTTTPRTPKEILAENTSVTRVNLNEPHNEEDWTSNVTDVEFKNDLVIHYEQNHLLFSVGAVIGITATIVFMVAALFVTRIYVKQKSASVISVFARSDKNSRGNGVCIYTSSVFHTPLPDTPTFENPVFTSPIDCEAKPSDFGSTIQAQVIYSMQVPTYSTFKQDSTSINTFYDHPPSTGSYRATSVPELPDTDCVEHKEHLYDEIPCWKQPLNVNGEDSSNALLSYYENCKDIN